MMKKNVLILILVLITASFMPLSQAENMLLKSGISKESYIEEIRQKAFENVEMKKDLSVFQLEDPFYKENMEAIQLGQKLIKDRYITYFSDGDYSIIFLTDEMFYKTFYFDKHGELIKVAFDNYAINISSVYELLLSKKKYPIKTYQYNYPNGSLLFISIKPESGYQYMFYPNGDLESYWVGDKCYNPDGSLQMKRDTKPFTEE